MMLRQMQTDTSGAIVESTLPPPSQPADVNMGTIEVVGVRPAPPPTDYSWMFWVGLALFEYAAAQR